MSSHPDPEAEDDESEELPPLPGGDANYMTPAGFRRLDEELRQLSRVERPKVDEVVAWAAGNGDRSENGDYIYGKRRLREIDRRIRFLTKRLDIAEVADPSLHHGNDQVFFGATVTYANAKGEERTITIKGIDEADSLHGALLRAQAGDSVKVHTPAGPETIEVIAIAYEGEPR